MRLSDLLSAILPNPGACTREIEALTENASLADQSTLFVCIRGARADGHDFAADAYARGCRAFVAEKTLDLPQDAVVTVVPDTRYALGLLACRLFGDPSHKMHLIGITGTKGKTTTAELIAHILNRAGVPCGYIGTNGISYADITRSTRNTTPDAVTLQSTLADMLRAGVKTAVIEVSSQALMQHRAAGTRFEAVLFTNLSPDHIGQNEHADFDDYKSCKKRLFCSYGARFAVCNADEPATREMLEETSCKRIITCSLQSKTSDFYAEGIQLLQEEACFGVAFSISHKGKALRGSLPLTGAFNVGNAQMAVAVATSVFDVPFGQTVSALSDARVTGRSEVIVLPNRATVVIDYAHNGTSLRQLLSTLRAYSPVRLTALFGAIGERAQMRRRELGEVGAQLCDLCYLTSDNPGTEDPEAIIDEIAAAFAGSGTPYKKIADRAEAIRTAIAEARPGDILVLAGKGHERYQLIGREKLPFCEREIVESAAKELLTEKNTVHR